MGLPLVIIAGAGELHSYEKVKNLDIDDSYGEEPFFTQPRREVV